MSNNNSNKTQKKNSKPQYSYMVFYNIKKTTELLMETLPFIFKQDQKLCDIIYQHTTDFLHSMKSAFYDQRKSLKNTEELYNACKRRNENLQLFLSKLAFEFPRSDKSIISFKRVQVSRQVQIFIDNEQIYKGIFYPKCYRHIYQMAVESIRYIVDFKDTLEYESFQGLIVFLSTVARMFTTCRPGSKLEIELHTRIINNLISKKDNYKFLPDKRLTLINLINYCFNNLDRDPRLKSLRYSIRVMRERFMQYTTLGFDKIYMSSSSGGTLLEIIDPESGKKFKTSESIITSVIDMADLDESNLNIKYSLSYFEQKFKLKKFYVDSFNSNIELNEKEIRFTKFLARLVFIIQKKFKKRNITAAHDIIQNSLYPLHSLLAHGLKHLKSDTTFNQQKGVEYLRNLTESQHLNHSSFDLTAATDTLSLDIQELIISRIFDDAELASNWRILMEMNISIDPNTIEPGCIDGDTFKFANGQPQGYLTSFPMLGWTNTFVAICSYIAYDLYMRETYNYELIKDDFSNYFRVLGDDIICSSPIHPYEYKNIEDPLDLSYYYLTMVSQANVECNIGKGFHFRPKLEGYEVNRGEFASVTMSRGLWTSGISSNTILKLNKSKAYYYNLLRKLYDNRLYKDNRPQDIFKIYFGDPTIRLDLKDIFNICQLPPYLGGLDEEIDLFSSESSLTYVDDNNVLITLYNQHNMDADELFLYSENNLRKIIYDDILITIEKLLMMIILPKEDNDDYEINISYNNKKRNSHSIDSIINRILYEKETILSSIASLLGHKFKDTKIYAMIHDIASIELIKDNINDIGYIKSNLPNIDEYSRSMSIALNSIKRIEDIDDIFDRILYIISEGYEFITPKDLIIIDQFKKALNVRTLRKRRNSIVDDKYITDLDLIFRNNIRGCKISKNNSTSIEDILNTPEEVLREREALANAFDSIDFSNIDFDLDISLDSFDLNDSDKSLSLDDDLLF